MASANRIHAIRPQPALATTYEGDDPELLERLAPLVEMIEISPDAIAGSDAKKARLRPEVLDEYANVSSQIQFVAHGVGLSIGSFDHWNESYLRLLDELFARFDLEWHSEHLAYTEVAGENVGTMLALPRSQEALDLICERVRKIQARYGIPFLLEHVIQLLPDAPAEFTPAGFLNAITSNTGCGLILDVYNLECDAHNQGLDISRFLEELDLASVRELHLAGGVQQNGFQLDIHSRAVGDSTLKLAREVATRAPGLCAVTFEFLKEAIPSLGRDTICAELVRVRKAMQQ
jgi:uncharacterized protein (UPF0276 family)